MARLSEWKRAFRSLGKPEIPRAERWPVNGLTAYYGRNFPSKPAPIKNISSSGIFLLGIQEPLPVGETVAITLQLESHPELSSELQIMIQARVARQDEFGVGLAFLLPPGLNAGLWEVLIRGVAVVTNPERVVHVFRTLRTCLFLCRICPSGAEEAIQPLGRELEPDRATTLFKIAHAAEKLLVADPDANRMRAHPKLVANLLRDGSWASDELTTQLWAGLFVSSCSIDEPDESNQVFVDLLIHITPRQAAVLSHACERALSSAPAGGDFTPASIVLGPDEIVRLTGVRDLARNATDLAYLFNLGLIQNLVDFTSYRDFERFDITPSHLGLELYRHCHGQRSGIDPQIMAGAREHLAVLFPSAVAQAFDPALAPDSGQEK